MTKLKSLYFRMTIVHYLGMIILPINALVFTQNSIAQMIQIIIAVALIFHELDEYKNGKLLSKELIAFLKNMDNKDV
ncbi:MAG: chemotaxis protein, partial [Deltaproteobacteria bacterium HGW-Deltaproteobacteria-24]